MVLVRYLKTRYLSAHEDAEDCAQEVLLKVMQLVQEQKLEASNYGGYIVTMLRNEYIRIAKTQARTTSDYFLEEHYYTADEDPVEELASEEMTDFLHECIQQLKGTSRRVIEYFLKYPDMRAVDIAEALNVSASSIWTRRHRIHARLLECIENKM